MNFGSDATDEQVHAAFASLIRKGALVVRKRNAVRSLNGSLRPGIGNCKDL